jgi:hypothetical protein
VTPYCPRHNFDPFTIFLTLENFLDCFEYQSIIPLYHLVRLRVVNGCEGNLRSDLMAKILEHVVIKQLGVVDCDVSHDAIAIDDILLENFLMVGELMFVTGFASIHFVKYSTATMAKV